MKFPNFDAADYVAKGDLASVSQWVANVVYHYSQRSDLTPEERGATRIARNVVSDATGMAWLRTYEATPTKDAAE